MSRTIQFHAQEVFATASGDYYQLYLGPVEAEDDRRDPFRPQGPYVQIQREFEFADDSGCNFETENEELCGHFPLRLIELTSTQLVFDVVDGEVDRVDVSFALTLTEFEEVRRIAEIVFGLKEPDEGTDDDFDLFLRKPGEDAV